MAKKKANKLNLVNLLAILLGIVSIVLFVALPLIKQTVTLGTMETVTTFGGLGMIFGGTVNAKTTVTIGSIANTDTVELKDVGFNTTAFVSLLLVILGIVATLMVTFSKSFKANKLLSFAAGALLVVGGVLTLTIEGSSLKALYSEDLSDLKDLKELTKLGIGVIVSSILAIVSGASIIVYPVLKK